MKRKIDLFTINKLRRALAAETCGPCRNLVSLRQTVVHLQPEIMRLRGLGYSWEEVASKLKGIGLEVKPNTLKNYALWATKATQR